MSTNRKTRPEADLKRRFITAMVMVAVFIGIFLSGGLLFDLSLIVVSLLIFDEWRAIEKRPRGLLFWLQSLGLGAIGALISGSFIALFTDFIGPLGLRLDSGATTLRIWPWLDVNLWFGLLCAGLIMLGLYARSLLSTLYTLWLVISLMSLSRFAANDALFWLGPIALVIATDIGGYVVGRGLGGPKLWPAVSPKKTWAGFLGGLVFSLVLVLLLASLMSPDIDNTKPNQASALLGQPWYHLIWTTLLLSAISQSGDLFQSALKRRHGVKDSGHILPGHGGVFDRFDGLAVVMMIMPWLTFIYLG